MNLRILLCVLSFLIASLSVVGQDIQWTNASQALSVANAGNKKMLLLIENPSNEDCISFKTRALTRASTLSVINNHFTSVKINSDADAIKAFKDILSGTSNQNFEGLNQLSQNARNNSLQVPIIVIFDSNLQILQKFEGYKSPLEFEKIVTFYGQNHYKTVPWSRFESSYD